MNLVVFLMRSATLQRYDELGLLERELALYRWLAGHGVRTSLVTRGDRREFRFRGRVPGLRVLCNWPGWSEEVYERWLPWLHAPALWTADLIKADQTDGAEAALWSARRWRKPLIARCGYMHAAIVEEREGRGSPQAAWAEALTRRVFAGADRLVVTTAAMAESAVERFGAGRERVVVIPNYVDTDLFRPEPGVAAAPRRICSVGRLHPEKNYALLLRALENTDIELVLVGTGPEEQALRELAAQLRVRVQFLGNRPHGELPGMIRSSAAYVLSSRIEGHPKALLEAMATGAAVIGTDVPGVHNAIRHGETGWLCAAEVGPLRKAMETVLGDPGLRARMGEAARRYCVENFALDRVARQELDLYEAVLGR